MCQLPDAERLEAREIIQGLEQLGFKLSVELRLAGYWPDGDGTARALEIISSRKQAIMRLLLDGLGDPAEVAEQVANALNPTHHSEHKEESQ